MAPTLPTMKLNTMFRLSFGCVMQVAANLASSREEEQATEVW